MLPQPTAPPLPQAFLDRLETLRVRSRRRFLGSRKGLHASPRRGAGLEFSDYRSYVPGDDPRAVDWQLFGRSERLYVKVFQEEEDLFVYLLVDASPSMRLPLEASKYDAARDLALALSYAVLSSDDAVRVHRLDPDTDRSPTLTPFYRGRRRLLDVARFLDEPSPEASSSFVDMLRPSLFGLKRPGKAILVSDLLFPADDLRRGLDLLRSANLDVAILQVLAPEDRDGPAAGAHRVVDAESGATLDVSLDEAGADRYRDNFRRHQLALGSVCAKAGAALTRYDTDADLQAFVLAELPKLGLLGV